MGNSPSAAEEKDFDLFSELDETEGEDQDQDLLRRNEEAELAILNDFVEALIDVAPPTWPPMA